MSTQGLGRGYVRLELVSNGNRQGPDNQDTKTFNTFPPHGLWAPAAGHLGELPSSNTDGFLSQANVIPCFNLTCL